MAERLNARPEIFSTGATRSASIPSAQSSNGGTREAFLMRGLQKVRAEVSLTAFVYNLRRALNTLGMEKLMAAARKKQHIAPDRAARAT